MLYLDRKAGEAIRLNGVVRIVVLAVEDGRVKLGIDAPMDVIVVREELLRDGYQRSASLPPRDAKPAQ